MLAPPAQRLPWNRAAYPTGNTNGPWLVDLGGAGEKPVRQTFHTATPGAEAEGTAREIDRRPPATQYLQFARRSRANLPHVYGASSGGIRCPSGGEYVRHLTVIVQEPTAWTSKN
jgi:hypothetical protein